MTVKNLRVGILGDTQLPGSEEEEQANKGVYKANLKAALELMKEQKVDLLIHVAISARWRAISAIKPIYPYSMKYIRTRPAAR